MNVRNSSASKAFTVAMALCFSVSAVAGFRQVNRTITVNQSGRIATGHLAGARVSADTAQQIGCLATIQDFSGGAPELSGTVVEWGYCYAVTTAGNSAFCFSSNPRTVAVIRNLQGDALLEFHWDENGLCTLIQLTEASSLEPKR